MLAILFGLLIPSTIIMSFQGTDVKSKDPAVQAGNLEAAVREESKTDAHRAEIQKVASAMESAHLKSEDAAAVYAGASIELGKRLTDADLHLLAISKTPARKVVAQLYADPPPAKDQALALVEKLPRERFLYQLARAQTLERLGDKSARRRLSPELDEKSMQPRLLLVAGLYGVGFLGGAIVIVLYVLGLASGSIKWSGHPVDPTNVYDADRLAVRAAQFFGVFLLIEMTITSFASGIPGARTAGGGMLVEVITSVIVIFGTLLLTRVPIGGRTFSLADYGFRRDMIRPALLWGTAGLFAVIPLATAGAMLGSLAQKFAPRPDHPLLHMLENPNNLWFIAGAAFLASVQAPITEELLFRGTLTPALAGLFRGNKYAVPLAIGISSLIFASIHPQGLLLWLPLASVGVVNGVLCYQTKSILPGIVMHALFNGCAIASTLLLR